MIKLNSTSTPDLMVNPDHFLYAKYDYSGEICEVFTLSGSVMCSDSILLFFTKMNPFNRILEFKLNNEKYLIGTKNLCYMETNKAEFVNGVILEIQSE